MFEWMFEADFWQQHSLWFMFVSSFLSATVLPGNSEIIFLALVSANLFTAQDYFLPPVFNLLSLATLGNTLGGLTTYWLGRVFPKPELRDQSNKKVRWVFAKFQRYGIFVLLLSWLPLIGDLLCAVAGVMRLNWFASLCCIFIGKALRYVFLLYLVIGYTFW